VRGRREVKHLRLLRIVAAAWLAAVLVAVVYTVKAWIVDGRQLETDFLALVPNDNRDPVVREAASRLAASVERDVLVLVGADDWERARRAGEAYRAVLARHDKWFEFPGQVAMEAPGVIAPWWRHRGALLSAKDRVALVNDSPALWAERAMRALVSPLGAVRAGAGTWQDDPFGLFGSWLRERSASTPVHPADDVLRVTDDQLAYVVIPLRLRGSAFALSAQRALHPVFSEARAAALDAVHGARVLTAGVLFPASVAARQASWEFSLIGWGSIAGIVLIVWITFRSLRPIGLVLLSLVAGTVCAIAVTSWWYPRVHLLTLVFGASLIGVAEDYGVHYLCSSDRAGGRGIEGRLAVMRGMLPGLALALATTVVSFIGLALSPFPGLRQMAVFAATGLAAAWVTVVVGFPLLDGGQVGRPWIASWYQQWSVWWASLRRGPLRLAVPVALLLFVAAGAWRLAADDDVRLLQRMPHDLMVEQSEATRIVQVPSVAQLFVVRASTPERLLQQEEALGTRLDSLVDAGSLQGYVASSQWVPSAQRQERDAALSRQRLYERGGALDLVRGALGEGEGWMEGVRASVFSVATPLSPEAWLDSPLAESTRHLWLGSVGEEWVSVVALRGNVAGSLPALQEAARQLPGVTWVDKVAGISSVLGTYRVRMSWVLALSYIVVWGLFAPRYGRDAWRLLAPSALASVMALATIGLLGQPLQLFHVLALYVVFGLGVDYAIFLHEHGDSARADAWLAIGLAAISTLLSLGLLAVSTTPVLRAFGVTMLIGITVSMLAAPVFCRRVHAPV